MSTTRRPESSGALAGYTKAGRRFKPPLQAYSNVQANDWVTDDLPDLLWPLVEVVRLGDDAAHALRSAQELVVDALDNSLLLDDLGFAFDGRLTSIEAVPPEDRQEIVAAFQQGTRFGDHIGPEMVGVLKLYRDAPGRWLLVEPWADIEGVPSEEEAKSILREAIVATVGDRHLNAIVKSPTISWKLMRGQIKTASPETLKPLVSWPKVEATRSRGDAVILSMFLVAKWPPDDRRELIESARIAWAREFWATNWRLAQCLMPVEDDEELDDEAKGARGSDVDVDSPDWTDVGTAPPDGSEPASETLAEYRDRLIEELDQAFREFIREAFSQELPVNLHNPSRHEVVCGLTKRMYRHALRLLTFPALWSSDSACGFMRSYAETAICLRWMGAQAGDTGFEKYKEYGLGRRILMRRHMESAVEEMPEGKREEWERVLQVIGNRGGGDWAEQFQEVSIETTFAGVSLRTMAEQTEQLDLYNHVFQSSSGVLHGEWWAIEDYELTRCLEPLHRFHLIPSSDDNVDVTLGFGQYLVVVVRQIVELGVRLLRVGGEVQESSDRN